MNLLKLLLCLFLLCKEALHRRLLRRDARSLRVVHLLVDSNITPNFCILVEVVVLLQQRRREPLRGLKLVLFLGSLAAEGTFVEDFAGAEYLRLMV